MQLSPRTNDGVPQAITVMSMHIQHGRDLNLVWWVALSLLVLISMSTAANGADIPGTMDHPLVPRYEGSEIVGYEREEFNEYALLIEPASAYGGKEKNLQHTLPLEGKLTEIQYRGPAERSALEVFRNYEQALKDAGFETLFSCAKAECGERNFNHAVTKYYMLFGDHYEEQRYIAGRKRGGDGTGDVYVSLYVVKNESGGGPNKGRPMIALDVIELNAMEERMVVLGADIMRTELGLEGFVDIYGILFDHDAATLRSDSAEQLEQIATLLNRLPQLRVLIVGHTDSTGSYEYNLDLSRRRADAVVDALVRDHGADRDRLQAVGVGMSAPVATNATEHGRARNRRVVLVEQQG